MKLKIIKIKNFKPLEALQKLYILIFENFPSIVLLGICIGIFLHFVFLLVERFLQYNTTVSIKYESPKQIRFPAFTICGCSSRQVACTKSSWWEIYQEQSMIFQLPVLDILEKFSFKEADLISQCYYFMDSRRLEMKTPCADIEIVVESLHDGRKCFSYFTILHDAHSRGQVAPENEFNDNNDIDNNNYNNNNNKSIISSSLNNALNSGSPKTQDQYTGFIYIKINFTSIMGKSYKTALSIQDASVIMSIHQNNIIPGMLESEYMRIEPGLTYEIHFGKQITYLKPKPYLTKCQYYDPLKSKHINSLKKFFFFFFVAYTYTYHLFIIYH